MTDFEFAKIIARASTLFAPDSVKRGIQEEFDTKAAEYETNRLAGWYKAHSEIVAGHLAPESEGRLLDIGCATGFLIRRMLTRFPGMTALGVDLSPRMIDTAQRNAAELAGRARFCCADWEAPPPRLSALLTECKADVAVCASVLHYFRDPVAALRHCRLSLVPGGTLYLLERRREGSLPTIAWDLAHRHVIRDHVRFYNSTELHRMIDRAGFRRVETVETVRKFFWNNKVSTNLTLIKAIR